MGFCLLSFVCLLENLNSFVTKRTAESELRVKEELKEDHTDRSLGGSWHRRDGGRGTAGL